MNYKTISPVELTNENIWRLSEEDISYLLNKLVSDFPKEKRMPYVDIILMAFDFRSIGINNRELKSNMAISGYKFFPIPYNNKLIWGVKRKDCKAN